MSDGFVNVNFVVLGQNFSGILASYFLDKYNLNYIVVDHGGYGTSDAAELCKNFWINIPFDRSTKRFVSEIFHGTKVRKIKKRIGLTSGDVLYPNNFPNFNFEFEKYGSKTYYSGFREAKNGIIKCYDKTYKDLIDSMRNRVDEKNVIMGDVLEINLSSNVITIRKAPGTDPVLLKFNVIINALPLPEFASIANVSFPNKMQAVPVTYVVNKDIFPYYDLDEIMSIGTQYSRIHRVSEHERMSVYELIGKFELLEAKSILPYSSKCYIDSYGIIMDGEFNCEPVKVIGNKIYCVGKNAQWNNSISLEEEINQIEKAISSRK